MTFGVHFTDEDREKQAQRRKWHRAPADPLAERERVIAFWKKCAETNKHYLPHNGAWWWSFVSQGKTWRWLLMPRLRDLLDARDRAWRDECARQMREYSEKCRLAKEAKAREKMLAEAPPMPLFESSP